MEIYASKHFRELQLDEKAIELEKRISPNNIRKVSDEYCYLASASRYYNMDLEIKSFINEYSKCNIVDIRSWFRYFVLQHNSGNAIFYEINLESVITE